MKTESDLTASAFEQLGLRPELLSVLTEMGYTAPTPIQAESIPIVLAGKDLLGQAATGTGKTAAFALPILQRLDGTKRTAPVALVLVPTRELAMQVSDAMHKYGRPIGARVLAVYGGAPIGRQMTSLERGVDIVVATPGRANDLIKRRKLDLSGLEIVVLDEADEMMDMGFADELDAILDETPKSRQTVLFSATMPRRIQSIAAKHLRNPEHIEIKREVTADNVAPRVRQTAYIVTRHHKAAAVGRILDVESPTAAIVFCKTRDQVDELTQALNGRGYRAEALHGGMDQAMRERVLNKLRAQNAELLIATDVAARGLDIDHLTHVINYDVPQNAETYVHRIGRVGRAGREGVAITMAQPSETYVLKQIERTTKVSISVEKLPTIDEVRIARMDVTTAALREVLTASDFNDFKVVVEALSEDFDVYDIAMAAIKMVHGTEVDEPEIPVLDLRDDRGPKKFGNKKFEGRDDRPSRDRESGGYKSGGFGRENGGNRDGGAGKGPRRSSENMTRIFVGSGAGAGMRPADLVGAIANETSLNGKQIGSIQIQDRFSLVEVPNESADEVINALKQTTIKGKKVSARRERF